MRKMLSLLTIAFALLMCVPLVGAAHEMNTCNDASFTSTASAFAPAVIDRNLVAFAMPAEGCTTGVKSTSCHDDLVSYVMGNAATDGHSQRLEVAARTRSGLG